MFRVLLVWKCSGNFRAASAHAFIFEIDSLGVQACQKNKNNLKFVVSYSYLPVYSTITMDSINHRILAPITSQWKRAS